MISLRHKNGGAEIHQEFSDLFFVVEGKATLLSGGDLQNGKTVSPGEMRGAAVKNGMSTELTKGDSSISPLASLISYWWRREEHLSILL